MWLLYCKLSPCPVHSAIRPCMTQTRTPVLWTFFLWHWRFIIQPQYNQISMRQKCTKNAFTLRTENIKRLLTRWVGTPDDTPTNLKLLTLSHFARYSPAYGLISSSSPINILRLFEKTVGLHNGKGHPYVCTVCWKVCFLHYILGIPSLYVMSKIIFLNCSDYNLTSVWS